jgi:hypothetical protein
LGVGIGQLERAGLSCQAKKSTVLPRSSKKTSRPSVSVTKAGLGEPRRTHVHVRFGWVGWGYGLNANQMHKTKGIAVIIPTTIHNFRASRSVADCSRKMIFGLSKASWRIVRAST